MINGPLKSEGAIKLTESIFGEGEIIIRRQQGILFRKLNVFIFCSIRTVTGVFN